MSDDVDRKLALKADLKEVESTLPARFQEGIRKLADDLTAVRADMLRHATKDDIRTLSEQKVFESISYFLKTKHFFLVTFH